MKIKQIIITAIAAAVLFAAPLSADEAYIQSLEKRISVLNQTIDDLRAENARLKTQLESSETVAEPETEPELPVAEIQSELEEYGVDASQEKMDEVYTPPASVVGKALQYINIGIQLYLIVEQIRYLDGDLTDAQYKRIQDTVTAIQANLNDEQLKDFAKVFGALQATLNERAEKQIAKAEKRQAELEAHIAKLTPKCKTPMKKGDDACWLKVANHADCYIWNPYPIDDESVTWSGQCKNAKPDGDGKYVWSFSAGGESKQTSAQGSYQDGKRHGDWVFRFADGGVHEGPFVDGKAHGNWVERYASGTVAEGPWVNGKRHGNWVVRFADGDVHEGPYVDGKRHGDWIERHAGGGGAEGPWVNDKRHGEWVGRDADGRVKWRRTYRNGE